MLTFDAPTHAYYWDGVAVPSVTQIMEDVGVIDYSHIPESTRLMALERGSIVHELTALDDKHELDESSVDPMLTPYLQAWRSFRTDSGIVISMVEHQGYQQIFRYAGTLDRSGHIVSGSAQADVLIDLKTNDAPPWTRYQTAAYANFFDHPRRFRRMAVELHKDGTYRVDEYPGHQWQQDFNIFCSFLTTWRKKRECNPHLYRRTIAA